MNKDSIRVIEISLHRNGDDGAPFYAIRFRWKPGDSIQPEEFLAMVFNAPGHVSVISLDRVPSLGVQFARGNSWEGDLFEGFLRGVVDEFRKTQRQGFTVPLPVKEA